MEEDNYNKKLNKYKQKKKEKPVDVFKRVWKNHVLITIRIRQQRSSSSYEFS